MYNLRARLEEHRRRLLASCPVPSEPHVQAFEADCSDSVRDTVNHIRTVMNELDTERLGELQHMLEILADEAHAMAIANQDL
ncbi:MAG: hypothetical protein SFY66_19675 [Oculatellaceae cyanobacterium bins.114]|nr:hypothetical protein [Oculatellaceae cyanobacterium bins.114]